MLTYFKRFAAYNKWANDRLYDACDQLSDADYYADRPAFFGSIHGVRNHMMVGDTIWTSRLHGTSPVIALNAEMCADRKALRDARQKMDNEIIAYMEGLSDSDMAGDVTYKTTSGDPFTMARSVILQHFFNHHAHHRGRRTAWHSASRLECGCLPL